MVVGPLQAIVRGLCRIAESLTEVGWYQKTREITAFKSSTWLT